MSNIFFGAAVAAAVLFPGTSALADIPQPAGVERCSPGYVGVIVWVDTAPTGYHEEPVCIH